MILLLDSFCLICLGQFSLSQFIFSSVLTSYILFSFCSFYTSVNMVQNKTGQIFKRERFNRIVDRLKFFVFQQHSDQWFIQPVFMALVPQVIILPFSALYPHQMIEGMTRALLRSEVKIKWNQILLECVLL